MAELTFYAQGDRRAAMWLKMAEDSALLQGHRIVYGGSDISFASHASYLQGWRSSAKVQVAVNMKEHAPKPLSDDILVLSPLPSHESRARYRRKEWEGYKPHRRIRCVPFGPGEPVTRWVQRKPALYNAFLSDNLLEFRKLIGPQSQQRAIGFVGYAGDWGRKGRADAIGAECYFTDQRDRLTADAYLRWMAACGCVPHFPGLCWNTHRFIEAVLIGTPLVCCREECRQLTFVPPVSSKNVILIDGWTDRDSVAKGLNHRNSITQAADESYRNGWSIPSLISSLIVDLLEPSADE